MLTKNQFPSFLFFSNYLILLFVWAELYHYHGMTIHRLRRHLIVVMGVMYAGVAVLFLVDLIAYRSNAVTLSSAQNVPQFILIIYLALLYLVTSGAYGVYAVLILVPLARRVGLDESGDRGRVIRRLLALTGLIVGIFLFRACMVFIGFFSNWSVINWFDLVYYGSCEVMPIGLMLFILLYRSPARAGEKKPLINN